MMNSFCKFIWIVIWTIIACAAASVMYDYFYGAEPPTPMRYSNNDWPSAGGLFLVGALFPEISFLALGGSFVAVVMIIFLVLESVALALWGNDDDPKSR